jgi:hypothetical protein
VFTSTSATTCTSSNSINIVITYPEHFSLSAFQLVSISAFQLFSFSVSS